LEVVYISHHIRAQEVSEKEFFTKGESGGTRCSSAYQLALKILESRCSRNNPKIYLVHLTDGDDLLSDNEVCLEILPRLLGRLNLLAYVELTNPYYQSTTFLSFLRRLSDPRLLSLAIKDREGVYEVLREIFRAMGRDDPWES